MDLPVTQQGGSCIQADGTRAETHKTIIVFGEKGAGKTSVINLLCNIPENVTIVPKCADSQELTCQHRSYKGMTYIETMIVCDVSRFAKFRNMLKLIKSLDQGVHLLIHVVKMGRISKSCKENYNIFVNGLCLHQVPVLVVITHCENDSAHGNWWITNEPHFMSYGMDYKSAISACPVPPWGNVHPTFARIVSGMYEDSKVQVPKAVKEMVLHKAWKIDTWRTWFWAVSNSFWKIYWSAEMPKRRITMGNNWSNHELKDE